MARIDRYLRDAVARNASDLHFSAGEPVRMRIDGSLQVVDEDVLTSDDIGELFREILSADEATRFDALKNLDRSYTLEDVASFRMNIFLVRRGIAAVVRTIPSRIPSMEELGLPAAAQALTGLHKGLVLVTGPTGSGKSTTLASMIDHINRSEESHILTVEDPVEFVHQSRQSLVNQREIGLNCHTFADALKYALREDPDVILVGEMRDPETIALALTAAETGHLVFATLHTRGAAASVDRIIDTFPANQQSMVRAMLAESLMAVISQALLKRREGAGRVAAYEVMITNPAIANLIREGKTFQISSVMQTGKREGMVLLAQSVRELAANELVSEEAAAPFLEDGTKTPKLPVKPAAPPRAQDEEPAEFKPKLLEKESHTVITTLAALAAKHGTAAPAKSRAGAPTPAESPAPSAPSKASPPAMPIQKAPPPPPAMPAQKAPPPTMPDQTEKHEGQTGSSPSFKPLQMEDESAPARPQPPPAATSGARVIEIQEDLGEVEVTPIESERRKKTG